MVCSVIRADVNEAAFDIYLTKPIAARLILVSTTGVQYAESTERKSTKVKTTLIVQRFGLMALLTHSFTQKSPGPPGSQTGFDVSLRQYFQMDYSQQP